MKDALERIAQAAVAWLMIGVLVALLATLAGVAVKILSIIWGWILR